MQYHYLFTIYLMFLHNLFDFMISILISFVYFIDCFDFMFKFSLVNLLSRYHNLLFNLITIYLIFLLLLFDSQFILRNFPIHLIKVYIYLLNHYFYFLILSKLSIIFLTFLHTIENFIIIFLIVFTNFLFHLSISNPNFLFVIIQFTIFIISNLLYH